MTFAIANRFNRYLCSALPLFALAAFAAGCGEDNSAPGTGGSGGSAATGGSGGSGTSGGTGGAGGTSGAGGSDAGGGTGIYGGFWVTIYDEPPPPYTKLIGQIFNGPQPPGQVLKLDTKEGDCELWVPKNPFCMGGCMGGVCVDENTCVRHPALVDVGIAHITGFKVGDLTIVPPDASATNYQPAMTLPPRACDEGGALAMHTDRFTLQGKCIAPLELMAKTTDKIPVKSGMPFRLLWTPPGQADISKIYIHLDIAHHGGKRGEINCEVPDTGSFDVPATLITKLVSLGLAGFPTVDVQRKFTSYAPNEPNIRLVVTSDVSREVDTGIVSCMDSSVCPPGQMCDLRDYTCK